MTTSASPSRVSPSQTDLTCPPLSSLSSQVSHSNQSISISVTPQVPLFPFLPYLPTSPTHLTSPPHPHPTPHPTHRSLFSTKQQGFFLQSPIRVYIAITGEKTLGGFSAQHSSTQLSSAHFTSLNAHYKLTLTALLIGL